MVKSHSWVPLTSLDPGASSNSLDPVMFEDKECSVCPDLGNVDKPPPGSGLNVKARVESDGCWPVDKATCEPIKDKNHPQVLRYLKRLRGMKHTKFELFDIKDGKWALTKY